MNVKTAPPAPKLTDLDFPVLPGWVLLAEAADMLNISRQHAYRLARDKQLTGVHQVGTSAFFVVSLKSIEKRKAALEERKATRASNVKKVEPKAKPEVDAAV